MSAAHYLPLFGLGCAASSLIAWLAASHPALYSVGLSFFLIGALLWFIGFMLDDLFAPYLGLDTRSYHALFLALALASVVGVVVVVFAPTVP